MNPAEALARLLDVATDGSKYSEPYGTDLLREALRRDWAVRVLDAWAEANPGKSFKADVEDGDCNTDEPWLCQVSPHPMKHAKLARRGATADAARFASARAVWPDLPEATRAQLGECS